MITDSDNNALAAELRKDKNESSGIELAIGLLGDFCRLGDMRRVGAAIDILSSYQATLESTLSVLEALEAKVEAQRDALPRIEMNYDWIEACEWFLKLLKNAQGTASEGLEK